MPYAYSMSLELYAALRGLVAIIKLRMSFFTRHTPCFSAFRGEVELVALATVAVGDLLRKGGRRLRNQRVFLESISSVAMVL